MGLDRSCYINVSSIERFDGFRWSSFMVFKTLLLIGAAGMIGAGMPLHAQSPSSSPAAQPAASPAGQFHVDSHIRLVSFVCFNSFGPMRDGRLEN